MRADRFEQTSLLERRRKKNSERAARRKERKEQYRSELVREAFGEGPSPGGGGSGAAGRTGGFASDDDSTWVQAWFGGGPSKGGGGGGRPSGRGGDRAREARGAAREARRVKAEVAAAQSRTQEALLRGDRVITSLRKEGDREMHALRELDVAAFLDAPSPPKQRGKQRQLMTFPGF